MTMRLATASLLALSLTACATVPAEPGPAGSTPSLDARPAPVSELVKSVSIPYESFSPTA